MLGKTALCVSLSALFLGLVPASGQVTGLSFRPTDAAYSTQLDKVIFIAANPNQLHIYDPVANADQALALPGAPQNVCLAPDGVHAAVSLSNSVVYADLKAKAISNTFPNISVGTGGVGTLVCGSGYIYVLPTNSSNAAGTAINISTGQATASGQAYYTTGAFDAALNAVYSTSTLLDIFGRYDASNGVLGSITQERSSYFGLFNQCAPFLISPDGTTIYSACGSVYGASSDPTKDMRYLGSLPGNTTYRNFSISPALTQLAAIPLVLYSSPLSADTVVNLFASDSLNAVGQFATTPFVVNGNSFPAHGRWVFYNSTSSSLFIVTQTDSTAGLEQDYAIENVNLASANSCGATFGAATASAPAPGSFATVQIQSGVDCTFNAVSNVPWITVASGYYGSGNTTLTYLVRPNLTATSRTGAISMGSQTLNITQNAAGPSASLNPLSFRPVAADYDKALDRIVMVSTSPNEMHIYDPVSQADQIVPLTYAPLSVSVRPDGQFAAAGHDGHVSLVNLQTFSATTMPVDSINGGILLAGNGYVYTFPGSPEVWGEIDSVQLSSGALSQVQDLYYGNIPRLDTSGNYLYVAGTDGGRKLDISTGPASLLTDSTGVLGSNIWLSEDGNRLVNSQGNVYFTSPVLSQDLQPDGKLSSTSKVDWAADSEIQKQIAVLTDPASTTIGSQLQIYAENGLALQREEALPGFSNNGNTFISHGKYLFWNSAESKLFAITEADSTSGLLSDFAVYTEAAPESVSGCTYSVSPSTLNIPPSDSIYNWTISVTTVCGWLPSTPSSGFLNLSPNSATFGNGQFTFYAQQNQGAARSSTITVGTQTVTVNQAASTCTYLLSSSNVSFPFTGGTGSVNLTTQAGCPWSAQSQSSWVSITSSQSGVGSATIQYSASPTNSTPYGLLYIGGISFYIQEASPVPSPATPAFVTAQSLATLRNNYTGFVGFEFTVGSAPIQVWALGRYAGTYPYRAHLLKLVQANGTDVPSGSVSVATDAGAGYQYAALSSPVTLAANTTYYLVSAETAGGDSWYDIGSVTTTSAASILAPVYADASGAYIPVKGLPGQTYGPLNFLFSTVATTPPPPAPTPTSGTSYVTADTPGPLRNNYSGSVGYAFTVPQALTVTALGRYVAPGNSASHSLQLLSVDQSGNATAVASASISLSGATSGQFTYAALSSSVTLQPNLTYYLMSQETAGGDSWYDIGPITVGVGSVSAPVYTDGLGHYVPVPLPGKGYVPLSFIYGSATSTPTPAPPAAGTALMTGQTASTLRNNYSGFVGTSIQVGATPLTVSSLGRFYAAGDSGTHTVKLVQANGNDVPGGSVSINMAGGTAGQYSYAALSAPVTLQANTTYYLVSQETYGGDEWCDLEPVTTTTAAKILGAVYSDASSNYVTVSALPGYSYGPLSLLYQ